MRAQVFPFILVLGIGTLLLAFTRIPHMCPFGFTTAERLAVPPNSAAIVSIHGRYWQAGGSAMLDYMPRFGPGPMFDMRREAHPLNVVLSVSARTRAEAERATFSCVRLRHGDETWSLRPTNYRVESPQWDLPGESWRLATALGGPEWPAGDMITMEAWLVVDGERYVLEFPPFALARGG